MTPRNRDYAVGYGKPPKHSQFKKGQSGNPKGRRQRRPKKIQTILNEVLNRKIRAVEAGTSRRMTIREVIITQLAAKAVKCDIAAINLLLAFQEDAKRNGEVPAYKIRYVPDKELDGG
jgi:Family of unknown function (DUF5681)